MPFFAQTEFQCGPAALATVLADAGVDVDADDLVPEVYVEGARQLAAGAARRDAPPRPHPLRHRTGTECARRRARRGPTRARLAELRLGSRPRWHYAVVVGIDSDDVILRSGLEQRRVERGGRFLRTWQRGSNWAFVAIEPGELPASATPGAYIRALAGAEPLLEASAAKTRMAPRSSAGRATSWCCSRRGPTSQRGRPRGATTLYRQLLAAAPQHVAARNNLANVLAEHGCQVEALAEARAALAAARAGRRARRRRARHRGRARANRAAAQLASR